MDHAITRFLRTGAATLAPGEALRAHPRHLIGVTAEDPDRGGPWLTRSGVAIDRPAGLGAFFRCDADIVS